MEEGSPEKDANFSQANASKLAQDLKNTPVNESRRSSYIVQVNSPVIPSGRVTFSLESQNQATPVNQDIKKAIRSHKATPMVRMSLNTSTVTKARKSEIPVIDEVKTPSPATPKPAPRVTFANTNTEVKMAQPSKIPQNKTEIKKSSTTKPAPRVTFSNTNAEVKKAQPSKVQPKKTEVRKPAPSTNKPAPRMNLTKRPPLHLPKKSFGGDKSIVNKSNISMANQTMNAESRKRVYNIASTESAYNFMNSMRNYAPIASSGFKKPTGTVAVGPKFLTEGRVGTRMNIQRKEAPRPLPPIRTVPRNIVSKTQPNGLPRKPVASVSSAAQSKRVFGPIGTKKVLTKAVTPHFASDDRIKIWHRKHDDVDNPNVLSQTFKAKPAPDFKKLHARSKLAQYSLTHKPPGV